MNADIQILFHSPLFKVIDFKCRAHTGDISETEWSDGFRINFTRGGNFGYAIGRDFYDIHSGVVYLENVGTEYVVTHDHHVKDECTSLYVVESLLSEMAMAYSDPKHADTFDECPVERFGFPSVLIHSTPAFDYFHRRIYHMASGDSPPESLQIDSLIIDFLQRIFARLYTAKQSILPAQLEIKVKDLHLETIDRAKNYIVNNFQNELSLSDIAHNAYVSPYHFSRLFKHFTSYSPYQYLLAVRLHHAELLLRNTSLYVTEICFESGFNSLEHFIAAFSHRYGLSPSKFRRRHF